MKKRTLWMLLAALLSLALLPGAMAETCTGSCDHVAGIGNNHFDSIQAAVDVAENGDTIKVLRNYTFTKDDVSVLDGTYNTIVHVTGKKITIDLNGKMLYCEYNFEGITGNLQGVFSTEDYGHLILKDSVGNAVVKAKAGNTIHNLLMGYDDTSSLTVDSGSYTLDVANTNTSAPGSLIYVGANENVIINGGNFCLENVGACGAAGNGGPWLINASGQNTKHAIVNGGTYNADIFHQHYPFEVEPDKTKALKDNGDGTYTMVDAVAYVTEYEWSSTWYTNEVGYTTFEEIVASANATKDSSGTQRVDKDGKEIPTSNTITLLKDCIVDKELTFKKDVIITGDHSIIYVGNGEIKAEDDVTITYKNSNGEDFTRVTVKLVENGKVIETHKIKSGKSISSIAIPRDGYTVTLYEDEACTTKWNTSASITSDTTIYVKAVPAKYTLTFNANGGEGKMAAQTFAYNVAQKLNPNTFTHKEYIFEGWNTKANGTGTFYADQASVQLSSNVTLYAQWGEKPSVCLAIYYPNGGTGSMKPQTLSGREAVLNPNTYVREGYEFAGWNTSADGTGDAYADGAKVPTRNSIILYAQWKKIDAPVVTEAPTAVPTAVPTAEPTAVPTAAPTAEPTATPIVTAEPTATPIVTAEPTVTPVVTAEPTAPVVTVPPVVNEVKITVQPEDQYVVIGQRATFKVEASGEGLSYQWYINRGNGWVKLDNAIGASYTTSVVDLDCDGFEYKCVVKDNDGCSAESEPVTLHVAAAPEIPETGDHANPVLWISMALLGLAGLILLRRKQYIR